jgi:hypothetical protein
LPPLLQDELAESFHREKELLQKRIEDLLVERDNSQQAFDKYRERARISLMKTANDQQAAENAILHYKEQLKVIEKHFPNIRFKINECMYEIRG